MRHFTFILVLLCWAVAADSAFCAQVGTKEAVAVADLWYAMELNSGRTKLDTGEIASRLAGMNERRVLYLISREEVRTAPPREGRIYAYIVTYRPTGYVIVSGDDRIEPILVYDAESPFTWDLPAGAFMRDYLASALISRWEDLSGTSGGRNGYSVHKNWVYLRARLRQSFNPEQVTHQNAGGGRSTYVKWDTALWDQGPYYNETVLAVHNYLWGGIFAGCTATSMAIKMRFHEWPPKGTGEEKYSDLQGKVVHANHYVNFGAQTYDWEAMDTGNITSHNHHIADLIYHCGVAAHMNYEEDVSLASAEDGSEEMEDHLYYLGHKYNTSDHEPDMITSIIVGLPVLIAGPSQVQPGTHVMVATGYTDTMSKHFYINLGWGGTDNGWYNLDNVSPSWQFKIEWSAPFGQPAGWMYVDLNWTGIEMGLWNFPFDTLLEGYQALPPGGHMMVHGGTYAGQGNVPITFNKKMKIKAYAGPVHMK